MDEVEIEGAFEGGGDVVGAIEGVSREDDGADVVEIAPWLFGGFAR